MYLNLRASKEQHGVGPHFVTLLISTNSLSTRNLILYSDWFNHEQECVCLRVCAFIDWVLVCTEHVIRFI